VVVQHRDQFALLVDSVADYAIFMLSPEGVIVTWNRGAERSKGYTPAEAIGQHFSIFYTPEDLARNHPEHELQVALRDGRYEEEGWRVRKDGSRFWANVVITPVRDAEGNHVGFGKVTRDLTARRLTEEQLRANTAELLAANAQLREFRRLVSSVRDYAIFMLDPTGRILTWNAGAQHIKGYSQDEIVGREFTIFYTDVDRAREHPKHELEIATREGRYEEEGWRVRKDGTEFWAAVTITALRDDDGELVGFAKVTRDLTERKQSEERLRRSNEELVGFAAMAAHDLHDPLRTIAGFVELIAREPLSEQAQEFLSHVATTTGRMQRLLTALLEFAKSGEESPPPESVPLRAAVERVLSSLAVAVRERGAVVEVSVPDEAVVCAAEGDIELVLQNLIANALKFGDAQQPRVEIEAERAGDEWRVTIADNGVGIAPADQERIFRAFERAHAELSQDGTGLGLAIGQRLAERNGGQLGVESAAGQGSRFWVLLPSAVATA
jgi:PAS domain S-box-containing protein